jgi:hypothetical protein
VPAASRGSETAPSPPEFAGGGVAAEDGNGDGAGPNGPATTGSFGFALNVIEKIGALAGSSGEVGVKIENGKLTITSPLFVGTFVAPAAGNKSAGMNVAVAPPQNEADICGGGDGSGCGFVAELEHPAVNSVPASRTIPNRLTGRAPANIIGQII